MSRVIGWLLGRSRPLLAIALGLSLLGALAWAAMPRQEDPTFPERYGVVTVVYPGADALDVERLVVAPLEEQLAEVSEIKTVDSQARANLAVLSIELGGQVTDTEYAWDQVKQAIDKGRLDLPHAAQTPLLRHDLVDAESVVLALFGGEDLVLLSDAAEEVKQKLLGHRHVKRVELSGVQTRQVTIQLEESALQSLGLDGRQVVEQLAAKNLNLPGGTLRASGRTITIDPGASFDSVVDLEQSPIRVASGEIVSLAELGHVRVEGRTPQTELARFNGQPAVFVGIIPKPGIDVVKFGRELRELEGELRGDIAPLSLAEMTFQPARVEQRLSSLGNSLFLGVLVVAAVLLVTMGVRVGLVVASLVPVVALSGLFFYQAGGGILQQISIAALIVALGLLVDNAIVVTESIQRRLDDGASAKQAAAGAVQELVVPLLSATATTLVAFLPMLLSAGNVGDFTRALPILLMSTLALSYLFSITVTPTLGALILRPRRSGPLRAQARSLLRLRPGREAPGGPSTAMREPPSRFSRVSALLARAGTQTPGRVVIVGFVLILGAFLLAARIPQQFFPMSDRDQLVVELALPEGTEIEETARVSAAVEKMLDAQPEVTEHAAFIGRSVPHFYINLQSRPQIPHEAQLYIRVRQAQHVPLVAASVRSFVARELVGVRVTPRPLDIGPPVKAPVEIRLLGDDPEELEKAALWVTRELEAIPEARDVSHDLGVGAPTITYQVQDAVALRHGITRADVAESLLRETSGVVVGQYRAGPEPVDIVLRTGPGRDMAAQDLDQIPVKGRGGQSVPLSQVATKAIKVEPAAIYHRAGRRTASVSAFLQPGATFSQVLTRLVPRLEGKNLGSVSYEVGGGQEKSDEANAALFAPLPIAALLLVLVLLAQFNSVRRVGIVLSTIPLAATGVIPGLLISGQAFGFMSMLGVFSLVGIVVNAAIVLLDQADTHLRDGASAQQAMRRAVELRTRPILLTVTTTVAGLLPLAVSPSPMWPPMAWSMISGLVASTALTLLVVPSLYVLLLAERAGHPARLASPATTPG